MSRMRRLTILLLILCTAAAALERQSNADYRSRREKLAAQLNGGVALIFADTEGSTGNAIWGFHQGENFYYLTGWAEPGAAVLIVAPADARPAQGATPARAAHEYQEILFLPARNKVQERWTGIKLGPEDPDVASRTGFAKVAALASLAGTLGELPGPVRLYTETPRFMVSTTSSEALPGLDAVDAFPNGVQMQDIRPIIGELRKVKDAGEIELIRKAADASVAAHLATERAMKPGVTEREISALMQYEYQRRGCERAAYAPIVGAGFNSTVLHYSQNSGPVRDGDVVVMDVAGEYSMYAMDITRTLPANGHFTPRQREIYNIVLGAQQAAIDAFVSGRSTLGRTAPDSLDRVARDYINTHGKDLHGQPLGQYFIHGLGHFVGLDVHDPGDTAVPLGPGMVFTLEPGVYIPEEKIGIRIEDTVVVGQDGKLINLTSAIPRTADDVERAMAQRR
jgi:Xaa-Pro aminopeptidase